MKKHLALLLFLLAPAVLLAQEEEEWEEIEFKNKEKDDIFLHCSRLMIKRMPILFPLRRIIVVMSI